MARTHGKWATYCAGCRCADCTQAASSAVMERNQRAKANGFATRTHGKPGTYTSGCRCDECRNAWAEWNSNNRKSKAYSLANQRAAAWLRENHPDEWRILLHEARAEVSA